MESTIAICAISDTHGFHDQLDMGSGDLLIHAGDFTCRGSREEVQEFADWIKKLDFKEKLIIAGNHELSFDEERFEQRLVKFQSKPSQLDSIKKNCDPKIFKDILCEGVDNIHYLEHEGIRLFGYNIFGSPYIPPISDWAFMLNAKERREKWQQVPATTDILVTHTPPLGIMDGSHRGCESLLAELSRISPRLHIFGHVHESYGQHSLHHMSGETSTLINAAIVDEDYHVQNAPVWLELPRMEEN